MALEHATDLLGANAEWVHSHDSEGSLGFCLRNEREQNSFVGHIERIEPEHLARRANVFGYRQGRLVDFDADMRCRRDFIERACDPPARWITEDVHIDARPAQLVHETDEARTVARNCRFERESFSCRHDRHSMTAYRATHDHCVAGTCISGRWVELLVGRTNARSVDVET